MVKWVLEVGFRLQEQYKKLPDYWPNIYMIDNINEIIEKIEVDERNELVLIVFYHTMNVEDIVVARSHTNAPILVISAHYQGKDKIDYINAGADEYIQWPENGEEAIASAKALIRRYEKYNIHKYCPVHDLLRYGINIELASRRVFINEHEVDFSRQEFELFKFLALNPCHIYTNEQIYNEVWNTAYRKADDNSINSCIRKIRRKLEQIPGCTCRIVNKWGVGYSFLYR